MSTARAFWHRLQPTPLQQQTREVLSGLRHDLADAVEFDKPADPILRHLRMSNGLNHLWGCLKNPGNYPARATGPSLRTADMHDAAMAIAREAVCLAAECQLHLQAHRQAEAIKAAEADWFDDVTLPVPTLPVTPEAIKAAEADWFDAIEQNNVTQLREMDTPEEPLTLQAARERAEQHDRQVHANHTSWGVRLLLVAAALAALSALTACGGGGDEPEAEPETTVPGPQNPCAANPLVCI